jgi:hypothetical protein
MQEYRANQPICPRTTPERVPNGAAVERPFGLFLENHLKIEGYKARLDFEPVRLKTAPEMGIGCGYIAWAAFYFWYRRIP